MTGGTVCYLYGIAGAEATGLYDAVGGLRGIGGAPVGVVADRGLAAVVGAVPAAEFEEAPLTRRLEDLDWLEAVARAHHEVVDAVAARTTVLPLRLATICRDQERVRALLAERRAGCLARLELLAGRVEWGVKVFVLASGPDAPGAPAERAGASGGTGLSPGRAYLRTRRHERDARDDAYALAEETVRRVRAAAAEFADEHAAHRVQQGPLARTGAENVANDAYLVPATASDAFLTAVREEAGGPGSVRVEITGPWAPYSFAADPEADPATAPRTDPGTAPAIAAEAVPASASGTAPAAASRAGPGAAPGTAPPGAPPEEEP
ncbi:GvpL/GvpF family gas vesicle protein [Streptomyces sp. LP05-1]|uniref:GvpL/GvpF family gas vesicle protein n=1 Tax=Streptomyces pyxinae TaxID=2970734 RepID=A0ABT2CM64_9ACTN|nr:GvpL/GvpF family gas vesicle protein [Streptomyces sp. LP05-1]MCS0638531.1 GvpL/GvpF family gas vesicle protein [Streptomyces sp. LP05-1]